MDRLLRLLANNLVTTMLALAFILVGLAISIEERNFMWLSRFGALVVAAGVLAQSRPKFVDTPIRPDIITETGFSWFDSRHWKALGPPDPKDQKAVTERREQMRHVKQQQRSLLAVGVLSPALVLLGTGLWGFADLLNHPFYGHP